MDNTFVIWFLYIIVPILGFVATFVLTKLSKGKEGL